MKQFIQGGLLAALPNLQGATVGAETRGAATATSSQPYTQIALRNMRSNVMTKGSNPIALGFAGVTLLFGALLIVAGVQTPNAATEMSSAAYFGVTDADLDMNDDDATGSNADEETSSVTETELEEIFDYTWIFPTEPEADGRTLTRLGARTHD